MFSALAAVDGAWGSWSSWSECPNGCGFALQSRSRSCDSPPPAFGGKVCRGLAHQTSVCVSELCNGSHFFVCNLSMFFFCSFGNYAQHIFQVLKQLNCHAQKSPRVVVLEF